MPAANWTLKNIDLEYNHDICDNLSKNRRL